MEGGANGGGFNLARCFNALCLMAATLATAFLVMLLTGCSAVIRDADGDSKEVIVDGAGAGRFVRAILTGK
jgi:hypothetical protein